MDSKLLKKLDMGLIFIVAAICILGLVMIVSATVEKEVMKQIILQGNLRQALAQGTLRHVVVQAGSLLMGVGVILIVLMIDYNVLAKHYMLIYIISNILAAATLVFGTGKEQWGANRWIRIGGFGFQPSDFVKIGIIIALAKLVADNKDSINNPYVLGKIIAFVGLPTLLILRQPDLGTSMAFVTFTFGILFIAGIKPKYIFTAIVTGIISLPFMWLSLKSYQKDRILVFLNPEIDPTGKGYHILQSKLAIGSGKFFGRGLFKGVHNKAGFLPEKHTDFIFSMIVEELGFLGSSILILLYGLFLYKCINIARKTKDDFGSFLVIGITCMLAFHIFANIGMTMGLMPVTGKPLPFVSYGGTFMLSNMIALGLVLNVNMRSNKINF
ncbi:cell elongation-specific peptidoglycan biosynthesis regulator RodA [Alkalithermobacter thermoalcaliphilus JW-YL-7 = DSM 7308]|uniref:Peptidoglycan glycosyltransferase RodA n=1 Tax=Alkalithermobacter thermoalcaliphilus JW-YL-7 = DSM 7308 TaxID=1121328 RepID=A0A150FP57_CLOPD|nr:rod shape-determining protein RodA [[Clostridium] paradoxum JW-YL-7 = DSM 7308]SHK52719.1 cell elongation-specific peptidoglycan biosynthesis regulator RodA [[Clostridium] paradoxum JW-YL-7 = DSM 7308]